MLMNERTMLDRLIRLGIELNKIHDLDILMERVLREARFFANADAGSIYIREGNYLNFTYTQNDTLQNRLPEGHKLIYSTFSIPINKNSLAGYVAVSGSILNIPNVYEISATSPYGFSKEFDEATGYQTRSICTIPLNTTRGDILGVLQIINAMDDNNNIISFSKKVESLMLHFAGIASVALERAQITQANLFRMIRLSDLRDPVETEAHVNRVGGYAVEIYEQWAKKHHLNQREIDKNRDILRIAAMLHDVGKVAISDQILKKPGRYNPDEYAVMKQHTILGARLFQQPKTDFDEAAFQVILNHHEKWDGTGYPGYVDINTLKPLPGYTNEFGTAMGKKGLEIPLFGRIVAIADVYDALASHRRYKEAWDEKRILATIKEEAGRHFDPELCEIFLNNFNLIRSVRVRYKD